METARLAVIAAQAELIKAQKHVETVKMELKEKHDELIESNYAMAENYLRVIKSLDDKLAQAQRELLQREQDLENKKYELIEAQKKLEALEKLREKQEEEYILEESRLEQRLTDERVTMKFANDMYANQEEIEV